MHPGWQHCIWIGWSLVQSVYAHKFKQRDSLQFQLSRSWAAWLKAEPVILIWVDVPNIVTPSNQQSFDYTCCCMLYAWQLPVQYLGNACGWHANETVKSPTLLLDTCALHNSWNSCQAKQSITMKAPLLGLRDEQPLHLVLRHLPSYTTVLCGISAFTCSHACLQAPSTAALQHGLKFLCENKEWLLIHVVMLQMFSCCRLTDGLKCPGTNEMEYYTQMHLMVNIWRETLISTLVAAHIAH